MISHSQPWIIDKDIDSVNRVLNSRMLAKGEQVRALEVKVADYLNCSRTIALSSGTEAIKLALLVLEIGSQDEVILPTYVCRSVADAIVSVGAKPVFCDVGDVWVMEPENIVNKISSRTKAIIIVHTFGIASDFDGFKKFGVPIIEDCCHAFGLQYEDKSFAGTQGDFGIFSFNATKCLSTGEGGMITIKDPYHFSEAKRKVANRFVSSAISDIQATMGISQLNRYNDFLRIRDKIANCYIDKLPLKYVYSMKKVYQKSIFFRFVLRIENLDYNHANAWFGDRGIAVRRGVDFLLHHNEYCASNSYKKSELLFSESLSIPIYPNLSNQDIEIITDGVNEYESKR